MIIPDRKKAVSVILSKMGPDGRDAAPDSLDEDDSDLNAIASDLISALESKSASRVVSAMKALISCIEDDDSEDSEG